MTDIFGANSTNRSMIKDPLITKNINSLNKNNIFNGLMLKNENILKSDQKNSISVPSVQNSNTKTV